MERPVKEVCASIDRNFKFEWIVKDFSSIEGKRGTSIESPEIQIDINGDCTTWLIRLFPYGTYVRIYPNVTVELVLVDKKLNDLTMQCEVVLSNYRGEQIATKQCSLVTSSIVKPHKSCVFRLLGRDNLLKNVSDNSDLTFIFDLKVSNYVKNFCRSSTSHLKSTIIDDLAKLREDADYSDIFITVCGSEFKAHKAILGARSTVFSSMFKHNMKEANSGKIEIEDMTPEVFEEFLKFIYTGIVNVEEYASELFAAADKYDVQDLKAICEEKLINNINEENFLQTLILSDLHSSTKMKEISMDFIVSNSHKTDKNKLAEIKNPALMLELVEALMNRKK